MQSQQGAKVKPNIKLCVAVLRGGKGQSCSEGNSRGWGYYSF